jgi:hypothetical protein
VDRSKITSTYASFETLFVKFDILIGRLSRDARSLFRSALNRPERLQPVPSELNRIGSEVDHAEKTLLEKIASVKDKCWLEDDDAMARVDDGIGPNVSAVVGDPHAAEN